MTSTPSIGIIRPLCLLLALAWSALSHAQEVTSRMSSRFLVRGERAILEVGLNGARPTDFPVIPAVEGVDIRLARQEPQTRMLPGRRIEYVFEFEVSSYNLGKHVIPPINLNVAGAEFTTEPLHFEIFNADTLQWSEASAGTSSFRYASSFRAVKGQPYQNETIPTEIKLYVPRDLLVDDWGIPDFERDGLTAWRFQPSYARSEVTLLGSPYVAVAYPSTLTPTRIGTVAIGPAKIRLVIIQVIMDGFPRRVAMESYVEVPRLELESLSLPDGAPEGFRNAVGNFRMTLQTEGSEFTEGDPIPIEIRISGSGNLDNLQPPVPIDPTGWKVYEASREQRGSEREEISGSSVFRQFLRPLEIKGSLPEFRLVYFDPDDKQYRTITSGPIPLLIKPAPAGATTTGPPPQAGTPVERMTDILGIVQPASLTIPSASGILPAGFWHGLAGLSVFLLIAKATWMRIGHRFQRNPNHSRRLSELKSLANIPASDDRAFLMQAGGFIEQWVGDSKDESLRDILRQRDQSCFLPDDTPPQRIDPSRRAEILRILRNTALLGMVSLLFLSPTTQASPPPAADLSVQAQTAYEEARFDDAIRLWLQAGPYETLSADTLYNIGNACYRSGSPGHAALYYRRALLQDPGHIESRQNLHFIERKYGSLTIQRPDYQYMLARIPLDTWKGTVATGAWMFLIGLLIFPATRNGARARIIAATALITGPMIAATAALGWRYYPNDSEFAPIAKQAVVVVSDVIVFSEASRNSTEVIDAPPGSLCEVVRHSGRWAYISFASKTRGWVPSESIEKILPQATPKPPTIRKPKADGKSA